MCTTLRGQNTDIIHIRTLSQSITVPSGAGFGQVPLLSAPCFTLMALHVTWVLVNTTSIQVDQGALHEWTCIGTHVRLNDFLQLNQ